MKEPVSLSSQQIASYLEERPEEAFKGSFGKLQVLAGSFQFPGAAQLVCLAALKSGAGYVYLESPISAQVISALPEVVPGFCPDSKAWVIGPGLDSCTIDKNNFKKVPQGIPIVIDGSALTGNFLELILEQENLKDCIFVATPHPGEAARLLGTNSETIQKDRTQALVQLTKKFPKINIWVLKGSQTLISHDQKIYLNTTGSVAMATAGQGDVLSGILGAFLMQVKNPLHAVLLGVYLHGFCSDLLSHGRALDRGVLPHEIACFVPEALLQLKALAQDVAMTPKPKT